MPKTSLALALVLAGSTAADARAAPAQAEARSSETPATETRLDRVAVRFFAPETGGPTRPRFITERVLSFEARLLAMSEQGANAQAPPQERHLRLALERHVAEELLSSLGIEGGGKERRNVAPLADEGRAELLKRIGGDRALERAATIEQIDPEEIEAYFLRHARAAEYLDRHVTPLLSPAEEQLREAFYSSLHPFRDQKFEDARKDFSRWLVAERVKTAEATFLQTARSRVKIIVVGH